MTISSGTLVNAGIEAGLIDAETVAELRVKSRRERSDLLETITLHGRFPPAALYQALAALKGLVFLGSRDLAVEAETLRRIPPSLLLRRRCLPVRVGSEALYLASADPEDYFAAEQIGRILGQPLTLALAEPLAIEARLRKALRHAGLAAEESGEETVHVVEERQCQVRRAPDQLQAAAGVGRGIAQQARAHCIGDARR